MNLTQCKLFPEDPSGVSPCVVSLPLLGKPQRYEAIFAV